MRENAAPFFFLRLGIVAQPTTPEEAIEQAALGPQSVTVDGNTVQQRSIDDLIKADKHLAAKVQMRSAGRLIFNKISPPGAS